MSLDRGVIHLYDFLQKTTHAATESLNVRTECVFTITECATGETTVLTTVMKCPNTTVVSRNFLESYFTLILYINYDKVMTMKVSTYR